ncbi:Vacuolar protein sorting-associated protein 26C-like, partial [Homarus americanus]
EKVAGVLVLDSRSEARHDGITLTMDGIVSVQLSPRSAGLIESIPISIINQSVEVVKSGKIPTGQTEIPFEIPLVPRSSSKVLYETYHGVYVTVQYSLRNPEETIPVRFEIRPDTLQNVRDRARIPHFLLTVCECERGISSIELQLVRVETCGSTEGYTREASEIQNIQIAEGDVCRGVAIPLYMVFPRLFTCSTTEAPSFKIEFELNVVIIFDNDHLVVETFPIKLVRS